jgi:hypothetical protein
MSAVLGAGALAVAVALLGAADGLAAAGVAAAAAGAAAGVAAGVGAAVEAVLATGAVVAAAEAALAFFFDLVVVCDGVVGAVEGWVWARARLADSTEARARRGRGFMEVNLSFRVFTSGDQVLDGQIGLRTLR